MAYYTVVQHRHPDGGTARWKRCGRTGCRTLNLWAMTSCGACRSRLQARKRPKRKKDRSVDARLAAADALLGAWLTRLALAVTKIQYYRRRRTALQRERDRPSARRPRQRPRERAIRIREEEG